MTRNLVYVIVWSAAVAVQAGFNDQVTAASRTASEAADKAHTEAENSANAFAQALAGGGAGEAEKASQLARRVSQEAMKAVEAAKRLAGSTAVATVAASAPADSLLSVEIRGRGLSQDATFQIDNEDVPFRMLRNNRPEIAASDTAASEKTMARVPRLQFPPRRQTAEDQQRRRKWFASGAHTFVIVNSDGQRAAASF